MNGPSQDRVRDVFVEVVAKPPEARPALLDRLCAGDAALRREVESLMAAADKDASFLSGSAVGDAQLTHAQTRRHDGPGPFQPGDKVGNYVVGAVIGTGGMGVVYAAEQVSPRRQVALKVIRSFLAGSELTRRFEREAAALAKLQHPGIAAVYEAGAELRAGLSIPFLAMELVQGVTLVEHARAHGLNGPDRLRVFLQVCDAVSHAHQRGVIHRDLKPANILVDRDGRAKVLDFGVARLLEADADSGQVTMHGDLIGTLSYMSPEQLEGDPSCIDVRTDVFALGAVLYELFAGRPPLDVGKLSVHAAMHEITTRDPVKLGELVRQCRGDIETIVAKALERSPERRYQSASEFAEDIRRYLRQEPVLARPATTLYRASKFVRRHRTLSASALLLFLTLTGGVAATLWQAREARRAEQRAVAEAQSAREVSKFIQDVMLAMGPDRIRASEATMRAALDQASQRLADGTVTSPEVLAELHSTLGKAYASIGGYADAIAHFQTALEHRRALWGDDDVRTLKNISDLAHSYNLDRREAEAKAIAGPALARCRTLVGSRSILTSNLITALANAGGEPNQLEPLYREALEIASTAPDAEQDDVYRAKSNLGVAMMEAGRYADAEPLFRDAYEGRVATLGDDHPDTLVAGRNLATCLWRIGKSAQAIPMMKDQIARGDRVLGRAHPSQRNARITLATIFMMEQNPDEAEKIALEAAVPFGGEDGPASRDLLEVLGLVSNICIQGGKLERAEKLAIRCLAMASELFGPDSNHTQRAMTLFVDLYEARRDLAKVREWNEKLRGTPFYQEKYAPERAPPPEFYLAPSATDAGAPSPGVAPGGS